MCVQRTRRYLTGTKIIFWKAMRTLTIPTGCEVQENLPMLSATGIWLITAILCIDKKLEWCLITDDKAKCRRAWWWNSNKAARGFYQRTRIQKRAWEYPRLFFDKGMKSRVFSVKLWISLPYPGNSTADTLRSCNSATAPSANYPGSPGFQRIKLNDCFKSSKKEGRCLKAPSLLFIEDKTITSSPCLAEMCQAALSPCHRIPT